MGQFSPSAIALSMSSGSATPSFTRRVASFSAGTRMRLTMKPGESFLQRTVSFFMAAATSLTSATVRSDVLVPLIISIRGMSWGGLKKCIPTTLSGTLVAEPRSVMLMEEVLEASTAPGSRYSSTRL
jgi:hypothetical protein